MRTFLHDFQCVLGVIAIVALTAVAHAGGGPERVFLVVNPSDPGSLEVANRYIDLRKIPPLCVYYLPWAPNANNAGGLVFRDKGLKPILAEIKRRGLEPQIDQIVYSSGFPYQLDFSRAFAGQTLPATSRPMLSLTGATYLYQFALASHVGLVALNSNDYCSVAGPTKTQAFRAATAWGPGAVAKPGGTKYLLSAALGFTTGSGNTASEIIRALEVSCAADGTRPPGTFYYMLNSNVRTTVRKDRYDAAIAELSALGLRAAKINGDSPAGKRDILGVTAGAQQVSLVGSRLVPGALVDNLTSAGGQLYKTTQPNPQTRISAYLRAGAAGASGTVVEPYAIPAKFPTPALHVHYARGATMAEAFYQSVAAPFQLVIIGDPLCQPWAVIPKVTVDGVPESGFVTGTLELTPKATYPDGRQAARYELYLDGVRQQACKPGETLSLDTAKLDDGYRELRVVAIDATPIETEGRWIGGIHVKNGADGVELKPAEPAGPLRDGAAWFELGTPVTLSVASTAVGPIVVYHNGREVARSLGGTGNVTIDSTILGRGRTSLIARLEASRSIRSRPLELVVE